MRKQVIVAMWGMFVLLCGRASTLATEPAKFRDLFKTWRSQGLLSITLDEFVGMVKDVLN